MKAENINESTQTPFEYGFETNGEYSLFVAIVSTRNTFALKTIHYLCQLNTIEDNYSIRLIPINYLSYDILGAHVHVVCLVCYASNGELKDNIFLLVSRIK